MGFWQTGYMEFHEDHDWGRSKTPRPPETFLCQTCGQNFLSPLDLNVHLFRGHTTRRPKLVYRSRACGASRLIITEDSEPDDWLIQDATHVSINGDFVELQRAPERLSTFSNEFVDVDLYAAQSKQSFSFEFALAAERDLQGVDEALYALIRRGELSFRTVDDFIMRSKTYQTAGRYGAAIATYLYGVIRRESSETSPDYSHDERGDLYMGKYDEAASILSQYDRPPAEAICGLVAFHHNQFELAMLRTKSRRVADVSLRYESMVTNKTFNRDSLFQSAHPDLDSALSDSTVEGLLAAGAEPLDGSTSPVIDGAVQALALHQAVDQLKIRLLAAEYFLARGNPKLAAEQARHLRDSRFSDLWFEDFMHRLNALEMGTNGR